MEEPALHYQGNKIVSNNTGGMGLKSQCLQPYIIQSQVHILHAVFITTKCDTHQKDSLNLEILPSTANNLNDESRTQFSEIRKVAKTLETAI
jgi:hypothetical protein